METMKTIILMLAVAVCLGGPRQTSAQSWVDITPASGPMPAARELASAVLDTQERRMIVFGGRGVAGSFNDVWAFDLDLHSWADLTPGAGTVPAARITPVSVYDPVGHRMITWSGQGGGGGFFNDTWTFDLATNAWSQYTPAGGPPQIRYGAAGVFDPATRDLVTFAGFTNLGRFDDVWRMSPVDTTWTDVSPVVHPLKRCLHSTSYDSHNHRMILYGGQNGGALADIWAYDLALDSWTELTPASSPPGRWFASHVYDAANRRSTVFGGHVGTSGANDVWVFTFSTGSWFELSPSGTPPSAREGAMAVYDGDNDRMVIFGGNAGGYTNDVWALTDLSDTPTPATGTPAPTASLAQNHPNPFNPATTIGYLVPPGAGRVTLRVYDVAGRAVRTLVNAEQESGPQSVSWNGRDDRGAAVSSGVYFYRLSANGVDLSRRMVLAK
jgi:hypothetical protein